MTALGGRPHAERLALAAAGELARGATCYVTLEPCAHYGRTPPCSDALVDAGVARVVTAIEDPDGRVSGRGHARLAEAGIEVVAGLMPEDGFRAHAGHITRMRDRRPRVTLKLAVSADGFIGRRGADGLAAPVAVTGEETRARVHMQRALQDAVLIGVGTALADDPLLTVRLPGLGARSPARIVVDSQLRLPPASRLVSSIEEAPLWIYTLAASPLPGDPRAARMRALRTAGADVIEVPGEASGRVSLPAVLTDLGTRGLTRLYVEGGAEIAASLLARGLVDRVVRFDGTGDIGAARGIPPAAGLDLDAVLARDFEPVETDRFGADVMTVYRRAPIALADRREAALTARSGGQGA